METVSSKRVKLTPRERQIIKLASEGFSSKEIGLYLKLSPKTIGCHLYNAYIKIRRSGVFLYNRAHLVKWVNENVV